MVEQTYQPIEDYGATGNLLTVALTGRNGSIDWLCVPHFDSPAVFAALIGADRGGAFRVSPTDSDAPGDQRYIGDSNVLQTIFEVPGGRLIVTDFLPVSGDIEGCGQASSLPVLHRLVECDVEVEASVLWAPRCDYGRATTRIERANDGYIARGGEQTLVLYGIDEDRGEVLRDEFGNETLLARVTIGPGAPMTLTMRWGEATGVTTDHVVAARDDTVAVWERWAHKDQPNADPDWAGQWHPLVMRSILALKLLTHAETGAFVAAATTSLPETMHGVRNWDYRFTWIRDAAMAGQAFVAMGHHAEMREFVNWAERTSRAEQEKAGHFKIMYSVHGEAHLPEEEPSHLDGYRGSRPVRIGNAAAEQIQHDILGELMDAAHELVVDGMELSDDIWEFLPAVADRAAEVWQEPDHGLWEMRREPDHYTYSKLMTWVALDRAIRLAETNRLRGDVARWREAASGVRAAILEHGYSTKKGAFVQTFGSEDLDAATLKIPIEGLLPFDDPRVQNTIDRIMEELMEDGLVRRYIVDDGLPGEEGGWVVCTTWLVDDLALSGRLDEAEALFDGLARRVNHVGLFSEQIDPGSGLFLGNFPQAFSHIGFIDSAVFLAHAKGRRVATAIPPGAVTRPVPGG